MFIYQRVHPQTGDLSAALLLPSIEELRCDLNEGVRRRRILSLFQLLAPLRLRYDWRITAVTAATMGALSPPNMSSQSMALHWKKSCTGEKILPSLTGQLNGLEISDARLQKEPATP